jgi:hypothetical protein
VISTNTSDTTHHQATDVDDWSKLYIIVQVEDRPGCDSIVKVELCGVPPGGCR